MHFPPLGYCYQDEINWRWWGIQQNPAALRQQSDFCLPWLLMADRRGTKIVYEARNVPFGWACRAICTSYVYQNHGGSDIKPKISGMQSSSRWWKMKATRHSLHQPNNRLVCFEGVETPEELKKKACILLMKILMPGFYRENCWLSAVLARLFHTSVRGCLVGDLVLPLMYCLAGCVGVKHSQFDECTVVMAWSGKLV